MKFLSICLIGLGFQLVLGAEVGRPSEEALRESAATLKKAQSLWNSRKPDQAIQLLDSAITDVPSAADLWECRAQIRESQKNWESAAKDWTEVIRLAPTGARHQRRAIVRFRQNQMDLALEDFDAANRLEPAQAPYNWQRGIALYYAKRFRDGREQFESHQTVNPADVENAVWHFLCTARELNLDEARRRLIPIEGDSRIPMRQVHQMFAGKCASSDVLDAAVKGDAPSWKERRQRFYANLYLALYYEATQRPEQTKRYLREAVSLADPEDYMGMVAQIHWKRIQ